MSKHNKHRICLAASAILVILLSCVTTPGKTPPWVAGDDELQELNRSACDGTSSLTITSTITGQGTNQFGTRSCEYTLTITNTNEDVGVWIYIYQHDKDGFANTEQSRWMGNLLVDPNKNTDWSGSIYLYTDEDANGPLMSIPEKIAGVYDIPECTEEKRDENFFELISVPVDLVCPME